MNYKNKNKFITSFKSFPNFHNQSPQIASNLTIYPLIQTTLSSPHNSLKSLQIQSPQIYSPTKQNQTKPKRDNNRLYLHQI